MQDVYDTLCNGSDSPMDVDEAAQRLEARVDRLEARMDHLVRAVDRLEGTIDRLDATCHRLDRLMRTMRWGMIVLTVLSLASTSLTVYLALQVGSSHGSSP